MKVSEITIDEIAEYLRLESGEYSPIQLGALKDASINFIKSYTGLDDNSLDTHEDIYIVVMILCQDMYDNRSLYVDKTNLNKVVETILGMHSINLL